MAAAIVLVSLAALLYLLQVNQGSWIEFNLQQEAGVQTGLNAVNALRLVQKDKLVAAARIDSVATTQLHMVHPSLSAALWLRVQVPATAPTMPREPTVPTGPLTWIQQAARALQESL